jgi:tripartite ATP-independent transporter DctP family solute receptor
MEARAAPGDDFITPIVKNRPQREDFMQRLNRRGLLAGAGAGIVASPFLRLQPARAAEFSMKYASNVADDHPLTRSVAAAAEKIRQKTGGRVDIQVFANSQLGSDTEMLSQVRNGAIDFYTISGLILAALVPVASINGIGFAFPNIADVWRAMDGPLGKKVRGEVDKFGVATFEKIWNGGYRQVTSSSKPIKSPADLKGFKIRVPVSPLWTSMFKAFGAAPASINWGEVYSSLQTKIVDGQETPLVSIESAKLYEVQKFCSLTNHMWDGFWMLANRRALERLPKDVADTIVDTMNAQALEQRAEVERLNGELQGALGHKGLAFNETDAAPFQDALRGAGFYSEWKGKYGDEVWALLETSVGRKLA